MKNKFLKILFFLFFLSGVILIMTTNFSNAFIHDGGLYLVNMNMLLESLETNSFTFDKLFFSKHFSAGYVSLLLLINNLFNNIQLTINITCLVLFLMGLGSFYFIIIKLFNKKKLAAENILITSILAFNPIVLAGAITFNIDFPVFIFYLVFLFSLFYQKDFLFILSSIMLAFSKETGALMVGMTFVGMIVLFLYEYKNNRNFSYKLRYLFYNALPLFILIIYLIYKYFTDTNILFKREDFSGGGFSFLFNFNFSDGITITRFFQLYVINFKWVIVLLILTLIGINKKKFAKEISFKKNYKALLIFILPYFAFIYLNLTYRIYINPRYLTLNDIFITIFLFYALENYTKSLKLKRILLSVILFLNIISIYNTLDPLSKSFFKTFKIGNKAILSMNSQRRIISTKGARKIPSHGRDELFYNLQYCKLNELCKKFVSKYRIDNNSKIIVPNGGDFYLFEENKNLFEIHKVNIIEIAKKYNRFFYVDLPNLDIGNTDLSIIKKYYNIKNTFKISIGEYFINIFRVSPKFNLKSKVIYKINNSIWGNLEKLKEKTKEILYLKTKNFDKIDIITFGIFSNYFKIPENYILELNFTPFNFQKRNSFLFVKENELYITNINSKSKMQILFGDGKKYYTKVAIPVIKNKNNKLKIIKKDNKIVIFLQNRKYIEGNFSKFKTKSYYQNKLFILNNKHQRVFFNGIINKLSIKEF